MHEQVQDDKHDSDIINLCDSDNIHLLLTRLYAMIYTKPLQKEAKEAKQVPDTIHHHD